MKPQYKLGTFVEFAVTGGSHSGHITAIIVRKDSVHYFVNTTPPGDEVPENKIIAAYKQIGAKKKTTGLRKATKAHKEPVAAGAVA